MSPRTCLSTPLRPRGHPHHDATTPDSSASCGAVPVATTTSPPDGTTGVPAAAIVAFTSASATQGAAYATAPVCTLDRDEGACGAGLQQCIAPCPAPSFLHPNSSLPELVVHGWLIACQCIFTHWAAMGDFASQQMSVIYRKILSPVPSHEPKTPPASRCLQMTSRHEYVEGKLVLHPSRGVLLHLHECLLPAALHIFKCP